MKKNFFHVLTCTVFAFLFSCSNSNSQNVLEPKAFKQKTEQQPEAVVVDVRTPAEFAEGHLPGALNIDVKNEAFADKIQELDSTKIYLLYCRSGSRTQLAAQIMKQAGFKSIFGMKGGFSDWEEAGYPVEKKD